MSKIIDFYFDFISPYSYIAYKKIKSMQNKNGVDFNYKPILLGGLHKLGNITAPAFNEMRSTPLTTTVVGANVPMRLRIWPRSD